MFQKLHGQGMAKMYLTFIIAALKAEKFQKPKCGSFFETPCTLKPPCFILTLTEQTVFQTLKIDLVFVLRF